MRKVFYQIKNARSEVYRMEQRARLWRRGVRIIALIILIVGMKGCIW